MAFILWLFEIVISAVTAGTLAIAAAAWCRMDLRGRRVAVFRNCPEPPGSMTQIETGRLDEVVIDRLFLLVGMPLALLLAGLVPPGIGHFAFLISGIAFSICAMRLLKALDDRHRYRLALEKKWASAARAVSLAPRNCDGQPGCEFVFPRQRGCEDSPLVISWAFAERPLGLFLPGPSVQSKP